MEALLSRSAEAAMKASRPVVICIDDDPPVLAAVRRLLRREPFELITTVSPSEVLDLLSSRQVSLIIADQRMPSMLGTELLKAVRQRSPKTACVILTGHADLSDIAGAMNDGAVDRLIRKPWDDDGFRAILRELLHGAGKNGTAAGARRREAGAAAELPARVVRRIACAGRTPARVLEEVVGALQAPADPPARFALVFDDLLKLAGPLSTLLSEVVRLIIRTGVRAALVDGSGSAGNFLELVGGRLPMVVYESEAELTAPKRILIVEDQDDSLEFLRTLIESAGHACEEAGSVEDALGKLGRSAFDLVLLDLVLPDAEGIEVARYILERQLKIPVVAISGFLDRWSGDSITQAGIRKRLAKPYRTRDILDAIRDS